jgi:uncharacterized SAM-binding protein YcdF (DUF218 family)
MFFILSKILYKLLMPASLLFFFLLAALVCRRFRKKLLITALSLFLIFSSPVLTNELFSLWEFPPVAFSNVKTCKVGVVLSGFSTPEMKPQDRTYFTRGADRLIHAVQLYKTGKIKKILVSGAPQFDNTGNLIEKENDIKNTLVVCGVAPEDILTEEKSRNTNENAVFTADLLRKNFPNEKILLITSSFHMRRAAACFRKNKIQFEQFPVDFYAREPHYTWRDFLPSEEAFQHFGLFIHEVTGFVVYRILGYGEAE